MRLRRTCAVAAALTGSVLVAPLALGAARPPDSVPTDLCLPLVSSCPSASSGPSAPALGPSDPTLPAVAPGTVPTDPGALLPGVGPVPSAVPIPGVESPVPVPVPAPTSDPASGAPVPAPRDSGAAVFTKTPASMGSEGLSFTGLSSVSVVTVPTVDGGGMRVLKITADSITVKGFTLTVRQPQGPGLVTSADTMVLSGHVTVYVGSITGTTSSGRGLTLGTDTPPPLDDVAPGLLRVTMGLVGSTADSISYTNTDQRMVQP